MSFFPINFNKSRRLLGAILLFILLDLTVLLINYQIAYQVSNDAVAINLGGRQRMLTQRMTKSLLQLQFAGPPDQATAEKEFREAMQLFDQTLRAFERGGIVIGSNGKPVDLRQIDGSHSRALIQQTLHIWQPLQSEVLPFATARTHIPQDRIELARKLMLQDNLQLLDLMNSLTSDLEQDSRDRADLLRLVQTLIFLFALINFIVIVRSFHLLAKQAIQTSEQFGQLAIRDPLTGLFNRRQFTEALKRETSAAGRNKGGFALLMINLDNFKPVNDLHGHAAGDTVLRTIATRLSAHARGHDTVARIGGDEFVLICPDLYTQQATAELCGRLMRSINEPIALDTCLVTVSASIGIAFYPEYSETINELIHAADQAMYSAKKAGRSRWFFAMPNKP